MCAEPIQIPTLPDDGLHTPEVGEWAEDKYRLVQAYGMVFTKSMQGKWDELVYLDLFAGAGRAMIRGTDRVVPSSPTLALRLTQQFNRYIFCEQDPQCFAALCERTERDFPTADSRFIEGDVNRNLDRIFAALPQPRPARKVLNFCFVDPFSVGSLSFETISLVSKRFRTDFLVLIPTDFDALRNRGAYAEPTNQKLDSFLGNPSWRVEWQEAENRGVGFDRFMMDIFGRSMERIGYIYPGIHSTYPVLNNSRRRIYRLAFFSRHPLGTKLWREVKKYVPQQRRLF